MSPTDEIKNRLDIVDFIAGYVQLKRAGSNFKACCPFHNEKTPSFMVSKPKQLWYCFGACSKGGDVFKFLMEIEGIDFPEALKILADKAGVTLPKYDKRAESKRNTLLEIMKAAADFYAGQLNEPRGAVARDYLKERGLSEAVLKQFSLGYAPDAWDSLVSAFRDKFKVQDVFDAGLIIRKDRAVDSTLSSVSHYYDRFRNRIMFPIKDIHGNTVGFTSRILDTPTPQGAGVSTTSPRTTGGKYINTPETLVYNKSRVLYGLDLARQTIRQHDYAVLVEGNMDVIACHQFGMTNVVASSGTALTVDQVRLLKRYTQNLKIAFDTDPAGQSAAKRGIDTALSEGMRIKVITIPETCGKDPDECIRKDLKGWETAVRNAREIMEYYLEKVRAQFDLNSAHGRSQFVNTLLSEVIKLPDLVEQDFWLKKVGEIVKIDERLLREQMGRVSKESVQVGGVTRSPATPHRPPVTKPRLELLSERLLALFLIAPQCAERIIGSVLPEMLVPQVNEELYTKFTACYTGYNLAQGSATGDPNFRQFWRNWALSKASDLLSTSDILELYGDKEFDEWTLPQFDKEAQILIGELRRQYAKKRRVQLAEAMRQAEESGDKAHVEQLAREFSALATGETGK